MIYLLVFLIVTALAIMLPARRYSMMVAGLGVVLIAAAGSFTAIKTILRSSFENNIELSVSDNDMFSLLSCDKLSAFFILVISFTMITGFIYSIGYLKTYNVSKPEAWIKLHYLALVWLQASMVMIPLVRNGFWFLMLWEIMTLSSFILVIFDFNAKGTIKAGMSYLIQMHVGMILILSAFIITSKGARGLTFDNLNTYFRLNPNWPVFLLFFLGFGLKAGFFLLHTWLPDAHPAAPSHVSGIMSGVMIKLGIYGILRVTTYLAGDFDIIGASVIIISAVTGLFGVMMAIVQHDVKKLLAYHSIENIGIIGIGIGLGIYGAYLGNTVISVAGYAGALLHTLNHSLFKSLLFYSAGSVISRVHLRDIEKMGGIMKYMPLTAWAFLIGSIAISGLPPFNGFISEFLIYTSIFNGFTTSEFYPILIFFTGMFSLVMIGGLALLCFTKVFSVVFLGQPRMKYDPLPAEDDFTMLTAKLLPVIAIFLIGFFPFLFIKPLLSLTGSIFNLETSLYIENLSHPFFYLSIGSGLLLFIAGIILVVRRVIMMKRVTATGPTWGCGYTAVDSRQQYTASSFIQEYASLSKPVVNSNHSNITYSDNEIFPGERDFHTHSDDHIRSRLINRPADFLVNLLRRAAIFQTGQLQHYVLYVLLFMGFIFLLTFLRII